MDAKESTKVNIVFRTDASVQIGTGHVMRCLNLADALRLKGASCTFICRGHTGHLIDLIRQRGHHAVLLTACDTPQATPCNHTLTHAAWLGTHWVNDAQDTQNAIGPQCVDWLVVDHYALDHQWEKAIRPHCKNLMVIDDLADRAHDCDLLLDQNLGRTTEDYRQLMPSAATALIGPQFALLRPEFSALREESLARRTSPQLKHLLITLGGVDKDNTTGKVLRSLRTCALPLDLHISVVMGRQAPSLKQVQAEAETMPRPTQVLIGIQHMARLMTDSDLVISAVGGTAWEICSLGLPSLIMTTAENQCEGALALKACGASIHVQNPSDLGSVIENPSLSGSQPVWLQHLSTAAKNITNGRGTDWVCQAMEQSYV